MKKEIFKSLDPDPESTRLAGETTIRQYREMVQLQNRAGIADLIRKRFEERYLNPVLDSTSRHGFTVLAVCCLMVEALESFRQGWPDSEGKRSEVAFCGFFQAHDEFRDLRPVAHEFYRAVRCAILHQAETTHGWRVHRDTGPLLQQEDNIYWISASEFGQRLRIVLQRYCETLETSDWKSPAWTKARVKLQRICRNSGVVDTSGLA